ncbi:MAG: 3-phosphoshikimate 1-carboxyvinyltransferase [Clostridia bacterium]|nr:3-phosphoshikimate 1-carboxyvinyltransferase [Clostridia bacterium]
MIARITPSRLSGCVRAPASKSAAHRAMICAALSAGETYIRCADTNADMEATLRCINALGARTERMADGVRIFGGSFENAAKADCGESGSTLRFLIPVAAALGCETAFHCAGRLPERPMDALRDALISHGATLSDAGANPVRVRGKLQPGRYVLPGNVSSQFVSGLLFALPLLDGESEIVIEGPLSSADYVEMTLRALAAFGIRTERTESGFRIPADAAYRSPGEMHIEGDWSGAAFWLCAGVPVTGLLGETAQGDRRVLDVLCRMGAEICREGAAFSAQGRLHGTVIDADPIPDLVPPLAAAAVFAQGETRIINAARLRAKESDRLFTTAAALRSLGADIREEGDGLLIHGGKPIPGGAADAYGDHRIAMAAAIAAVHAEGKSIIRGAESVNKSYPGFWRDLESLGGQVSLSEGE